MELVGLYGSPFVRRVAVTAQYLGIALPQRPISIFKSYDEMRAINPMVKVPTLLFDNGSIMVESTLIIAYLESLADATQTLMPNSPDQHLAATRHIGPALVAMEKAAQLVYETSLRPEGKQHAPWKERLVQQLMAAIDLMEAAAADAAPWILGEIICQADLSIAIAWEFLNRTAPDRFKLPDCPALSELSVRAEAAPQFAACGP